MRNDFKSFLYFFDLIGVTPQLFIFKNKRYKSIFSSVFSLLILLISIIYSFYSFYEYLKFDTPIVGYFKDNDNETVKSFDLKDNLLIFTLIDSKTLSNINKSDAYFEGDYKIFFNNGTIKQISINIEKCQLGKNINIKYKEYINEKKSVFGKTIEDFYCINDNNDEVSLFLNPKLGFSIINIYVNLNNNSNLSAESLQSLIVAENNIINHNNKNNPIKKSYIYQFTTGFSSSEYTLINYDFEYIKYESDNGIIFKKSQNFNGMTFSNINFFRMNNENFYKINSNYMENLNNKICTITFKLNQSNFDSYKRSYKKLQSLIAEIVSVVSLLIEIGTQMSIFLYNKKISIDIIRNILNKKENYSFNHNNKIQLLNDTKKEIYQSERKNIKPELAVKKDNTEYLKSSKKNVNINNNILKNLNFMNIIKTYFCFKDNKTKLINICNNIVIEDMSIENILERIYCLENLYNYFSNEEI